MAPPKDKELKPAEVAAVKKKAAARKPFFTLGGGFIKMNIVFPPILAFVGTPDARIPAAASTLTLQSRPGDTHCTLNVRFAAPGFVVKTFLTAPEVEAVLKGLPIATEKIPYVVAAALGPIIFISGLVPIMGLAVVAPDGYDNVNPRMMKSAEGMKAYPVLHRLQSAHQNTVECAAMAAPAFWVASTLGLESLLFAKLSALLLLARLAYFPFYAMGLDALRTTIFAVGFFATTLIGFAPIFPETILPLIGQALPK